MTDTDTDRRRAERHTVAKVVESDFAETIAVDLHSQLSGPRFQMQPPPLTNGRQVQGGRWLCAHVVLSEGRHALRQPDRAEPGRNLVCAGGHTEGDALESLQGLSVVRDCVYGRVRCDGALVPDRCSNSGRPPAGRQACRWLPPRAPRLLQVTQALLRGHWPRRSLHQVAWLRRSRQVMKALHQSHRRQRPRSPRLSG